jgi:tripartite-type tricarboxylate transporter receptor subunit TctC
MNTQRRFTLAAAAATALGLLSASPAWAQAKYPDPNQTIRFVVPYPAGGATDTLARSVAHKLGESWKVPVIVENKPGASGTIGSQFVARAAPDGNTVLFSIVALVQQITLMTLPYDPLKDFTPITRVAISPSILAVPKETPANNAREFAALVKSQPGKFNFGSYGAGTSAHIQGSLLNMEGGLDMVHVPYQGGAPLVNAMLGNQLSAAFLDAGSSRPHLPKFKLLGITGTQRVSWLPDVPTFKEQGYANLAFNSWFGIVAPAKTPPAVIEKLNAEITKVVNRPEVRAIWGKQGAVPMTMSVKEFDAYLRKDIDKWADVVKKTGAKAN